MIDEKKALDLIAQGEGQHVEFKESVPSKVRELSEEVCAFSNASGGYVFIGVNNKSEFIKGFTIDNTKRSSIQDSLDAIQPAVSCEFYPLTVQGHDIWVIEVLEGDNKPYVASGSIFVRRGANSQKLRTPAEMRQLFDDAGALHFDEAFNKWFQMDEVSEQAVREFKEKAGITSPAPAPELIRNLELLGLRGEMTNVVPMFFSVELRGQRRKARLQIIADDFLHNSILIFLYHYLEPLFTEYSLLFFYDFFFFQKLQNRICDPCFRNPQPASGLLHSHSLL